MAQIVEESELSLCAFAFAMGARRYGVMTDLAAALFRAVAALGITAAASGLISGPKAASPDVFHFTNWPDDWTAYYLKNDFLLVDPAVRWARNSGVAITWTDLIARLAPRDTGRKVIEACARFGFTEGMAVPARSGDNALGLVCFGGPREALSMAEQEFLIIVGRAAFHAAERIRSGGDIGRPAPVLSVRESECLTLLVRGHTDREIGKILGLSEATVRFHLGNARDKSGAVSRTHLAALGVAQGHVVL